MYGRWSDSHAASPDGAPFERRQPRTNILSSASAGENGERAARFAEQRRDLGQPDLAEQRDRIVAPVVEVAGEHQRPSPALRTIQCAIQCIWPCRAREREVRAQQRDRAGARERRARDQQAAPLETVRGDVPAAAEVERMR